MTTRILQGDCRDVLKTLPDQSVHCVVTSPPYHQLRDYGVGGQIGLEESQADYVAQLVLVFREVGRVLRDDGTLWVNLGANYGRSAAKGQHKPGDSGKQNYLIERGGGRAASGMNLSDGRRSTPLRPLPNAPACDTCGKALLDYQEPGCACRDLGGAPQADSLSHHEGTAGTDQSFSPGARRPSPKGRGNEPMDYVEASPGVLPRDAPASKSASSCVSVQGVCGPVGEVSEHPSSKLTCERVSRGSAHTSGGTDGIGLPSAPSVLRRLDKALSDSACGCGSCGVCWAYLAIPILQFKEKDLISIPSLVALALQADGWTLRSDIIWAKRNCMPESVRDRPTTAHEHVFLLTKGPKYFYDAAAIEEDAEYLGDDRASRTDNRKLVDPMCADGGSRARTGNPTGAKRNKRSVWWIATQPFAEAHFATFPPALIEPCILAGTSERGCCAACGAPWVRVVERTPASVLSPGSGDGAGRKYGGRSMLVGAGATTTGWRASCKHAGEPIPCTVLDPFAGAGTTGLVADRLQRNAILIELNPEYAAMAERRIRGDAGLFAEVAA